VLEHCYKNEKHNIVPWSIARDHEYGTCANEFFSYFFCLECDAIFLWNPPLEKLSSIYPSNYYSFNNNGYSLLYKVKFFLDRQRFKKIFYKLPFHAINILDVGGGIGLLSDQVKKVLPESKKVKTWICDLDEQAKFIAEEKGHEYVKSTFQDFKINEHFQIVLAFNIIEHVQDPFGFINKMQEVLVPGGIGVVQTPNWNALDSKLFKRHYWGGLHAPRHFYIFSKKSLRKEMEGRGFEILKHKNVPAGTFWTYSVLSFFNKSAKAEGDSPMYSWASHNYLVAFFSFFDLIRGIFFRTSQQYLVIRKL
jgi:2-polyprenyl-3-methyl-5-hydroxy-6-metoxy-1,4-benzoquinol methylase